MLYAGRGHTDPIWVEIIAYMCWNKFTPTHRPLAGQSGRPGSASWIRVPFSRIRWLPESHSWVSGRNRTTVARVPCSYRTGVWWSRAGYGRPPVFPPYWPTGSSCGHPPVSGRASQWGPLDLFFFSRLKRKWQMLVNSRRPCKQLNVSIAVANWRRYRKQKYSPTLSTSIYST